MARSTGCGIVRTVLLVLLSVAGCAGPGPRLFPAAPERVERASDGGLRQWYDTNDDGRTDYFESFETAGMLASIGYDTDGDGMPEEIVRLDEVPPAEQRHLLIALDSVPADMVADLWNQGRFRYCPRPARVISPFPVMTDLSFSEFFGTSPSPGVESAYYDGHALTSPYSTYAEGGNVKWYGHIDYHLQPIAHGSAYLDVYPWFGHELRRIQDLFLTRDEPLTVGYCVGASALGAIHGRDGHQAGLVMVDRLCQQLLYQTRGRARFSLFSDHGHYFEHSRRVPLADMMARLGYRVGERLKRPGDLIVPEFSMVSCAAFYTHAPAAAARDAVGIEGIELAAYLEGEELIVLSRDGKARITRANPGFRYTPDYGDPLMLKPVLTQLSKAGQVAPDGAVRDEVLLRATVDHSYPDAVARLWRAFHGLVEYTPDVLLSLADGYHAGSKFQTDLVTLIGVHGSLRPASTYGFAITTAGELPATLRMEDLRPALKSLGVPFEEDAAAHRPTSH
ncbi:MAG: hypothetical protein AMXMBFR13_26400 [Phycisphaerae bacterium]